jgi:cytochrome c oxidase subunit 2
MFIVFAAVAVAWSLLVMIGRRRAIVVGSFVAVAAAAASIAIDVRAIHLARSAPHSGVAIRIIPRGDWWQLEYARDGVSFVTANELHVPTGTAVSLSWSGGLPPPSIGGAVCVPRPDDRCTLVAGSADEATFVRLWPPMWRHLPIVVEPWPRFEQWLRNEALPARSSDSALFVSAGCAYCHVVRGAATSASLVAPDLTHFAARRTIAATALPNRRGFLDGWVVHSRALKRGSAMPDNRLDPAVLRGILAYLESLR